MIKKIVLIAAGSALVVALLFGSRAIPYASTMINKARQAAHDSVPISVQIDTARDQLQDVDGEIKDMMREVAKEEVDLNNVRERLAMHQSKLDRQYSHIMRLKDHLESGDEIYVSRNRTFSNDRVEDELRSMFRVYKTSEQTIQDLTQTLEIRDQSLAAAKERVEETISQRRELASEIEKLTARKQMVDVQKTANKLNFDGSELAEARSLIQDISTRIDVEAKTLDMMPQYVGSIPMDDEAIDYEGDISNEIDTYFKSKSETEEDIVLH